MRALEKENLFLREEIEKCKFDKKKDEYNKFISGLTHIKKRSCGGGASQENESNQENRKSSVLKESSISLESNNR